MNTQTSASPELLVELFVAGDSEQIKTVCKRVSDFAKAALKPPYRLAIIDVLENPALADRSRVLVTPTLVIHVGSAERRLVGDLSDFTKLELVLSDWGAR
jgi:circadian clock protein KaiB